MMKPKLFKYLKEKIEQLNGQMIYLEKEKKFYQSLLDELEEK